MSEVDSTFIRQGFWINYSHGSILGATITTNQRVSNVVVAILAIVVSIAMTSAWNLLLFAAHQYRATPDEKDGLFRQQQILFRSLASPGAFLSDSIKMLKVWSFENINASLRCMIPALVALAFLSASIVAGVFSSYILSTESLEVLVQSSSCKDLNITTWLSTVTRVFDGTLFADADSFIEQCYQSGPLPSRCEFYLHPRIQLSVDHAECPFSSPVCFDPTKALSVDSGYLDSNDVLGINAPSRDRVQFRRKAVCSPLNVADYISVINATDPAVEKALARPAIDGEQIWAFNYGPVPKSETDSSMVWINITQLHSMIASNVTSAYTTITSLAYGSADSYDGNTFAPIHELQLNDSDLTLTFVFLNNVRSSSPIDDPVYSAHSMVAASYSWGTANIYPPDLPAGVIGCSSQFQFCVETDSSQPECTHLQGASYSSLEAQLPSANQRQLSTLSLLQAAAVFMATLQGQYEANPPYLSTSSLDQGSSVDGLPDDQWTQDVRKKEEYVWSFLKIFLAQHATGFTSGGTSSPDLLTKPSTNAGKWLCNSQKVVKPSGFANISVFGLAFTLTVSGLLLMLDFGVLRFLILSRDMKTTVSPKLRYWFEDGAYQLQRAAYEAYSDALWGQTDNEVPITASNARLRNLAYYTSLENAGHSRVSAGSISIPSYSTTVRQMSTVSSSQNAPVPDVDGKRSGDGISTRYCEKKSEVPSSAWAAVPIPEPWQSFPHGNSTSH